MLAHTVLRIVSQNKDRETKQLIICVKNTQDEFFRPKKSGVVIYMEH